MVVVAWPKKNNNPYLDILYTELEKTFTIKSHKETLFGIRGSVDVLHLHWINSFVERPLLVSILLLIPFVMYIFLLKIKKIRLVWTLHNSYPFSHTKRYELASRIYARLLFLLSNNIVIHSMFQKKHIPIRYHWKVKYIEHHNYSAIIKNNIGINPDTRRMLFFGSVSRYKGVVEAIRAFKSIDDEDITFEISGLCKDAAYMENIKKLMNDNIVFNNVFFDDSELIKRIKGAGVIILPFSNITNSGSLVLALSCRRPVIIKQNNLVRELLEKYPDLINVFFVFNDYDELSNVIKKAMRKVYSNNREFDKVFDTYLYNTNIELIVEKYIDVFIK